MDDSRWPSMIPVRSRTTGSVSPTYPMIARRLRYDSAGFPPLRRRHGHHGPPSFSANVTPSVPVDGPRRLHSPRPRQRRPRRGSHRSRRRPIAYEHRLKQTKATAQGRKDPFYGILGHLASSSRPVILPPQPGGTPARLFRARSRSAAVREQGVRRSFCRTVRCTECRRGAWKRLWLACKDRVPGTCSRAACGCPNVA